VAEVIMPQLGMNMTEGTLVQWLKAEGEPCVKGEPVAVIETDKAEADIEAPADGVLSRTALEPGETAPVGTVIAHVRGADESEPAPEPRSTPGARRAARALGVAIEAVAPARPGARITEADVRAFAGDAPAAPRDEQPDAIRLATARKMEAARAIPHFYVQAWADVGALAEAPGSSKLVASTVDVLVRACAGALREHPQLLTSWVDGRIRRHADVNVGFAVETSYGLVVPVIKQADRLDRAALAEARRELVARARERRLAPDDVGGGTFTVTNLGVVDVELAWPLINPPEAAILAAGRAAVQPVWRDGAFEPVLRLGLTLAADHRLVDGAEAARFLHAVVQRLREEER
jgi:pyruvate dehydrogenase E2 component (dihydrolipoamide acetyltransferase)